MFLLNNQVTLQFWTALLYNRINLYLVIREIVKIDYTIQQ